MSSGSAHALLAWVPLCIAVADSSLAIIWNSALACFADPPRALGALASGVLDAMFPQRHAVPRVHGSASAAANLAC